MSGVAYAVRKIEFSEPLSHVFKSKVLRHLSRRPQRFAIGIKDVGDRKRRPTSTRHLSRYVCYRRSTEPSGIKEQTLFD